MLKKTMTYTDYNGTQRTEDFYFNLSKAELAELNASTEGGLEEYIKRIVAEQNFKEIVSMFKKLITLSYGEKSLDGKRFIKSDEITAAFVQTEAYSDLFMELASDAQAASDFVNGIVPADLRKNLPAA